MKLNTMQQLIINAAQLSEKDTVVREHLAPLFPDGRKLNVTIAGMVRSGILLKESDGVYKLNQAAQFNVVEAARRATDAKLDTHQPAKINTKFEDLFEQVDQAIHALPLDMHTDRSGSFTAWRLKRNPTRVRAIELVGSKGILRIYAGKEGVSEKLEKRLSKFATRREKAAYTQYVTDPSKIDKMVQAIEKSL